MTLKDEDSPDLAETSEPSTYAALAHFHSGECAFSFLNKLSLLLSCDPDPIICTVNKSYHNKPTSSAEIPARLIN